MHSREMGPEWSRDVSAERKKGSHDNEGRMLGVTRTCFGTARRVVIDFFALRKKNENEKKGKREVKEQGGGREKGRRVRGKEEEGRGDEGRWWRGESRRREEKRRGYEGGGGEEERERWED